MFNMRTECACLAPGLFDSRVFHPGHQMVPRVRLSRGQLSDQGNFQSNLDLGRTTIGCFFSWSIFLFWPLGVITNYFGQISVANIEIQLADGFHIMALSLLGDAIRLTTPATAYSRVLLSKGM